MKPANPNTASLYDAGSTSLQTFLSNFKFVLNSENIKCVLFTKAWTADFPKPKHSLNRIAIVCISAVDCLRADWMSK